MAGKGGRRGGGGVEECGIPRATGGAGGGFSITEFPKVRWV